MSRTTAVLALCFACACHGGGAGAGGAAGSTSGGAGGAGGALLLIDAGPVVEAGCGTTDGGAGGGCAGLEAGVGYVAEIAPIFAASCSGELCHDTPRRSSLVGVASSECCDGRPLVVPGDPSGSYLMSKLMGVGMCAGGTMPAGAPLLPEAQIDLIRRWICEGAPAE